MKNKKVFIFNFILLLVVLTIIYGFITSDDVLREAEILEVKFTKTRDSYAEQHEFRGDVLTEMNNILSKHSPELSTKMQAQINDADLDDDYYETFKTMTGETFINDTLKRDPDFFFWVELYMSMDEETDEIAKRYEVAKDEYYNYVGKMSNKPALLLKQYKIVK